MPTTRFGVSVDTTHATTLSDIEDDCRELDVCRSEIVDAILTAFLASDREHTRDVRQQLLTREEPDEKTQFGVSIRESTADELAPILEATESLDTTRSAVVDVILGLFFGNDRDHATAVRQIVKQRRLGKL